MVGKRAVLHHDDLRVFAPDIFIPGAAGRQRHAAQSSPSGGIVWHSIELPLWEQWSLDSARLRATLGALHM